MSVEERELELQCPKCNQVASIKIPESVFSQKKFGSIKIQVPPGAVCPDHQFIVFLDPKGLIRGYEKIDIQMAAPKEEAIEDVGAEEISLNKAISFFGLYGFFSLFHAKLFGFKAYVLRDNISNQFSENVNKFFDETVQNKYTTPVQIEFLDEENLNKLKLKEKNSLLIDPHNNILQTPWDEKLEFEENSIKKALEIIDQEEQKVLINQDVSNFIRDVEQVVKIVEDVKEIYDTELIDQLSKDLKMPKISKNRLNVIREFIKLNISDSITKKIKNKVQEFLNFL
ncbi:MAG: hypothetical protein GF317_11730 [Candidatus Lokiarchaeota archaeon]|nr:hypothetical protein [Candidatus Lokiarchaeota archaeon]MBD3200315.1 hypothetical protein [Candidatus Lokiarchaeota archaeon]